MVLLLCVYMYTHSFCSDFLPGLIVATVQYIHYRDVYREGRWPMCPYRFRGPPYIRPCRRGVHIIRPTPPPLTNHCWLMARQVCFNDLQLYYVQHDLQLTIIWFALSFFFLRFTMKVKLSLFVIFLVISDYSHCIKAQVIYIILFYG